MPFYDYRCRQCEHEWEAEQRISDEPLEFCPVCRRESAQRQIGATSFALKGAGWARDGYGR